MPRDDRISEVYLGQWGGELSQKIARARIDWLTTQAKGSEILDVGCSQGILSILLGRKGFRVRGIDINLNSINFAKSQLAEESDQVKNLVSFQVANFLEVEPEEIFDTVFATEVIEHLPNPDEFLSHAGKFLKTGGILVLTTPFGNLSGDENLQCFMITDVLKMLANQFEFDVIEVVDGYIRIIAKKSDSSRAIVDPESLLPIVEEAAIESQRSIHSRYNRKIDKYVSEIKKIKKRDNENEALNDKYRKVRDELDSLRRQNEDLNRKFQKIKSTTSYQIYTALSLAISKPGRNTLALPVKLWKLLLRGIRNQINKRKRAKAAKRRIKFLQTPHPKRRVKTFTLSEDLINRLPGTQKDLRVAAIMDPFTFHSYNPECNLLQLTFKNWQKEISEFEPHLLFIESAWLGKDESWYRKIGNVDGELVSLVQWCKNKNIPTIFWNKEDPIHFETFINTAELFDFVFTTDVTSIGKYKHLLGHNNVFALPFAAQPALQNPVELYERKDAFNFAGAYYVRYSERQRDLRTFIDVLSEESNVEIFDRNFGKDNPNYMFPEEYKKYIIGHLPFEEIDKAYKGYRFGINLNSIKHSQSMFARRAFELLASNTAVVSNYSQGIRLLLGDLVISTDNDKELRRRVKRLINDDTYYRKFKLAGLRKVLSEHTYEDRLEFITRKVFQGKPPSPKKPEVLMIAKVDNEEDLARVISSFKNQIYADKSLIVIVPPALSDRQSPDSVTLMSEAECNIQISQLGNFTHLCYISPKDYYGPNYLTDLALATRYVNSTIIGKASFYEANDQTIELNHNGKQYRYCGNLTRRSSMISRPLLETENLSNWLNEEDQLIDGENSFFAIDEFNYCNEGIHHHDLEEVMDLSNLNHGISIEALFKHADNIMPTEITATNGYISAKHLAKYFPLGEHGEVELKLVNGELVINSKLRTGKHLTIFSTSSIDPERYWPSRNVEFNIEINPGLMVGLVFYFMDENNNRIDSLTAFANRNYSYELPGNCKNIVLGLRVCNPGNTQLRGMFLSRVNYSICPTVQKADHLLITNNYPEYTDLYRNGFVHARIAEYKKQGLFLDVVRFHQYKNSSAYEFNNIDVVSFYKDRLHALLSAGNYQRVLIHVLDQYMWDVLKHYVNDFEFVIWLHGAEIQPWHRRIYNYRSKDELNQGKMESAKRVKFWKKIFSENHANIHYVFVSQYFADEVMEDMKVHLQKDQYSIIPNYINTELFKYVPKTAEQRRKILSIRPYASRKYANDLSVKAVLELSKEPFFEELDFAFYGKGEQFEETVAPIRKFKNVKVEQRFLTHHEISALHKEFGIFLTPTRMDSQGVSRDEAMSSGLVPVTNAVAAIPEFVDDSCGILAPEEDHVGLTNGIRELYNNPELFMKMSRQAQQKVRSISAREHTIDKEISLIINGKKAIK